MNEHLRRRLTTVTHVLHEGQSTVEYLLLLLMILLTVLGVRVGSHFGNAGNIIKLGGRHLSKYTIPPPPVCLKDWFPGDAPCSGECDPGETCTLVLTDEDHPEDGGHCTCM